MSDLKAIKAPKSISAGAPSQTPLGELTAPPDPLDAFKEPTYKGRGRKGGEGKRREGRGEGVKNREMKRRKGKGENVPA